MLLGNPAIEFVVLVLGPLCGFCRSKWTPRFPDKQIISTRGFPPPDFHPTNPPKPMNRILRSSTGGGEVPALRQVWRLS
jgi:hypothetical protein